MNGVLFNTLVNEFNNYAKKENLEVEMSLTLYTYKNSSLIASEYGSTIEHLLRKHSVKYDIIFYDVMYSPRYAPYFIDLGDWLPAEHMSHFSSGIATQSCKYKDKWVGLPITYEFNVLYCNTNLLKKHNKKIPKTWNELLEIGKYIRDNDENSNELLLYNGFFPYSEAIVYSTQEFIYSFRNEKNFPYPEYTSREAENALNKLMEIKEELASDEIFMAIEIETFIRLFTGKGLFLKYWYYPINNIPYKIIPLVGNKEGISGSAIGGTNVGINKYIAENQKKLAVDALKYMTSVETQKKLMLNGILKSAIISLYDDPEVCQIIDCELIKSIQPIIRPSNLTNNYDEYSMKFSELIQNFLYKNKTATETLIAIDDIVRFHSFSIINSSTPKIGILIFIISVTTLIIILLTIVLIFIKKYRYHFRFLSIDFWIIILIGLIFHTSIIFTYYGNLSIFKCKLKFILLSLGFSLIFIPFLYKLIVIFQKKFNYKSRIKNHKYLFFLGFILFDIIMIIPIIRVPYKMKENIIHDGKNYLSCIDRSVFGITIKFFSYTEKVLIVLAIIFFLFVEWNILEIVIDIRLITSAVSVDIILYILYFIVQTTNFKNHFAYFLFPSIILIIFTLSNFFIIFGVKFFRIFTNSKINYIRRIEGSLTEIENNDYSNMFQTEKEYRNIIYSS